MNNTEFNIQIHRREDKISSVMVEMPVWHKETEDGFLSVNVPLFDIRTYAKDENDADIAVREAIKAFCLNAEDFGQGLEKELMRLGWKVSSNSQEETLMTFSNSNHIFNTLLSTGDNYIEKVDMEELKIAS